MIAPAVSELCHASAAGTTPVVVRLLPRAVVLLRAAGNEFA